MATTSISRRALEILLMALAYYATGRLALLFAIPPGYATAVWPAAGVALAGMLLTSNRVWPGVLLGHFFVNLFTAFDSSTLASTLKTSGVALGIAAGGTLQALAGSLLIARFVGTPNALCGQRDVIKFLLLGGPLSCLVGATIGVSTLFFSGLVPAAGIALNWGTWWVGDAIGVTVAAPVALLVAMPKREVPLRRKWSVAAPLGIMLALVMIYFMASEVGSRGGWQAWVFLTGGLLFSGLFSAFLMVITGHSAAIARLVAERTAELQAANQELEAFSYTVAHDLRSPLMGVAGFAKLLAEAGDKLDDKCRRYLEQIQSGTGRMAVLIDDLLNLARVNRARFQIEPTDLSKIACDVVSELRAAAPTRKVEVDIGENLSANCDPGLVRIALGNLLSNAWKFTAGRENATIKLAAEKHDGETVFVVSDNGVGFDMKDAPRLFTPFARLHGEKEFSGTGVGLATVARIIRRHAGRIWAQSKQNEGASFYFTLSAT